MHGTALLRLAIASETPYHQSRQFRQNTRQKQMTHHALHPEHLIAHIFNKKYRSRTQHIEISADKRLYNRQIASHKPAFCPAATIMRVAWHVVMQCAARSAEHLQYGLANGVASYAVLCQMPRHGSMQAQDSCREHGCVQSRDVTVAHNPFGVLGKKINVERGKQRHCSETAS